jgi:hypothetical protein
MPSIKHSETTKENYLNLLSFIKVNMKRCYTIKYGNLVDLEQYTDEPSDDMLQNIEDNIRYLKIIEKLSELEQLLDDINFVQDGADLVEYIYDLFKNPDDYVSDFFSKLLPTIDILESRYKDEKKHEPITIYEKLLSYKISNLIFPYTINIDDDFKTIIIDVFIKNGTYTVKYDVQSKISMSITYKPK